MITLFETFRDNFNCTRLPLFDCHYSNDNDKSN